MSEAMSQVVWYMTNSSPCSFPERSWLDRLGIWSCSYPGLSLHDHYFCMYLAHICWYLYLSYLIASFYSFFRFRETSDILCGFVTVQGDLRKTAMCCQCSCGYSCSIKGRLQSDICLPLFVSEDCFGVLCIASQLSKLVLLLVCTVCVTVMPYIKGLITVLTTAFSPLQCDLKL